MVHPDDIDNDLVSDLFLNIAVNAHGGVYEKGSAKPIEEKHHIALVLGQLQKRNGSDGRPVSYGVLVAAARCSTLLLRSATGLMVWY